MHRRPPDDLVRHRKSFFRYYVPAIAVAVAGPITLSIYAMAVWRLTEDLRFTNSFPWSTGPLSNWMVWLGFALVANLGALTRPSERPAEKRSPSPLPVLLEELTVAEWPLEVEEERTPGQLARGER
jgi:hypothetical protein